MPRIMNPDNKAVILDLVTKLLRRNYTQARIAAKLGVSQAQVCAYVKEIKRLGVSRVMGEAEELGRSIIDQKLDQLRAAQEEAWEAWDKSWEDVERTQEEYETPYSKGDDETKGKGKRKGKGVGKQPPDPVLRRRTTTRTGRLPDPQYLARINDLIKAERELLGLDKKDKDVGAGGGTLDWDSLLAAAKRDGAPPDAVERILAEQSGGGIG